jgi:CDP-glucose 4,6-dehydratase
MFWDAKRVFLTGHTGFKGSWLSLWLQQLGASVSGYSLAPPTNPSLFEAADVAKGMRCYHGDICDADALRCAVHASAPEIVIHMAAQPLVRRSYEDPLGTYKTNVMGTANLLDAVRGCDSVRAVVVITTDKCYENQEWIWPYREEDRLGGHDPYSNSKACAELVVSSYRNSFFPTARYSEHGVAIASARAGNVIGGGDWAQDRLIPDVIRAFASQEVARIRNPQAIRPWQHVLEPLRGYLMLAEQLYRSGVGFSGAWNFGPQYADARPVDWIVRRMALLWGPDAGFQIDGSTHPHEAKLLKLDWSKAANELKWEPALSLAQALELTVAWYRGWQAGAPAAELTASQIEQYGALADSPAALAYTEVYAGDFQQ